MMTRSTHARLSSKRSSSVPVGSLVSDEHVSKKVKVEVVIPTSKPDTRVAVNMDDAVLHLLQSSGKSVNTSRLHPETGQHYFNFVCPYPFALTSIRMPGEALEGQQVLILDMKPRNFKGFLDLPGELRNQVYGYLFVKEGCDVGINEPAATSHKQRQGHPTPVFSPRLGFKSLYKGEDMSIHGIRLLQVCRQVRAEAANYFYGSNSFHFQTTKYAQAFLDCIGPQNRKWISAIDLGWILKHDIRTVGKLVLDCKNLRRLHFNLTMIPIPPYQSIKEPHEVVTPFRAVLKEMYERDNNDYFKRITWTFPEPACGSPSRRIANKKMRDRILEVTGATRAMMNQKKAVKKAVKKAAEKAAAKKATTIQSKAVDHQKVTMRITRGAARRNAS